MNLPEGYPHEQRKLGFEWANGSRHARIDSVLKSIPKVTLEDSMRLQNDITSIPARRLVALIAPLRSSDAKTKAALSLLRGWDGVERAGSPQAALFEGWISRRLGRAFLNAVLPARAAEAVGSPDIGVMLDTLEKGTLRGRNSLLLSTLAAAYSETERLLGGDTKKWEWGKLHHSLPAHPLLETVTGPLRAKLQVGPFPKSGGPYTPNQSAYRSTDFRQTGGPSFRVVLDVGNWDNSRAVNYPGQSGNPDDPHYRDLPPAVAGGRILPLALHSRRNREGGEGAYRADAELKPES
jgi:penicillin amidase